MRVQGLGPLTWAPVARLMRVNASRPETTTVGPDVRHQGVEKVGTVGDGNTVSGTPRVGVEGLGERPTNVTLPHPPGSQRLWCPHPHLPTDSSVGHNVRPFVLGPFYKHLRDRMSSGHTESRESPGPTWSERSGKPIHLRCDLTL